MSFLLSLVEALLFTIAVEFAVYLGVIRRSPGNLLLYSALINSFTNPLLNYIYIFEFHNLWTLEASVILIESLLILALAEASYSRAFFASVAANLASALLGHLLPFSPS